MRQLIIARKDLQMSPGKLAAQCCHASLAFLTDPIGMGQGVEPIEKDGEITGYRAEIMLEKATYEEWFDGSFTKTVCGAKNRNQLLKAKTIAEELGLVENKDFFLIRDACHTELEPEEFDENGEPPAAGRPAARGSGHPAGGGSGGGDLRRGGAAAGGRGPGGGHGPARRGASCPLAAAEVDENSVHFSRKTASSGYFADKRTCNRSGNMVHFKEKARYDYDDLLEIIRVLRSPEGCPWDQVQTHQSIRRGLLEEAYEAAEGIDRDDADLLREELGDVLMQVVFHADIERQRGRFTMEDVVDGVVKKLIFRHPHVFGGAEPEKDAQSVLVSWDAIKRREKHQRTTTQAMDSVARSLPALWRAEKLQKKAADDGFDWPDIQGALSKLDEEVGELHQAVQDGANVAEELGDVLFAAVKAARFAGVDPEDALNAACEKFIRRYGAVEHCRAAWSDLR